jgi:serine protease Do
MTSSRKYLLPSLALAVLAPHAWAEKEVVVRRIDTDSPRHVFINDDDEKVEKEKVTYLGIMTRPVDRTLSTQLGLPKDTGLVVGNVMEKSPAAEVLKRDDILTKFDDQILIDTHQLGVLVRAKKEEEEVKLTLLRDEKEMSVKVKLGVHEVPKLADAFYFRNGGFGAADWQVFMPPEGMQGLARVRELPGMGPDEARDVLRMIEHERGNFLTGPGMRIHGHGGKGSTILDLPKSNIAYSDDEGSFEIKVDEGKRHLTVKNAKGEVAFDGPINTEEERKKMPPEVRRQLEKLNADTFEFEVGEDFKPDVVPLPPEPAKTKISHDLGRGPISEPDRVDRSF